MFCTTINLLLVPFLCIYLIAHNFVELGLNYNLRASNRAALSEAFTSQY